MRANPQDDGERALAMSESLIDEDIRNARTLPSRYYTEQDEFDRLKAVFTGWQFAAHVSESEAHNLLPLDHLEAINGESVLLVSGAETACLSNVCTHPVSYTHLRAHETG